MVEAAELHFLSPCERICGQPSGKAIPVNSSGICAFHHPMLSLLFATAVVSSAPAAPSQAAALPVTPAAQQLFERDWVLMNWALKLYDRNGDILLEPAEAAAAPAEFRRIADANGDGRITPDEYRAAREFILARY
jgi:hypothetical protein